MLISRASHFVSYSSCQRSDKPWEIFTLSQRKSSQPLGQRQRQRGGGGTVWKMNEEEDEQILQGVNKEMRRRERGGKEGGKEGEKAEIPSSGFSLKPLVKVNEGCSQSSETDYITAPLINGVSVHLSLCVHVCVSVRPCFNTCATGCTQSESGMQASTQCTRLCLHVC